MQMIKSCDHDEFCFCPNRFEISTIGDTRRDKTNWKNLQNIASFFNPMVILWYEMLFFDMDYSSNTFNT